MMMNNSRRLARGSTQILRRNFCSPKQFAPVFSSATTAAIRKSFTTQATFQLGNNFLNFRPRLRPLILSRSFASSNDLQVVSVPTMGESISEGSIAKWNKNVGDTVKMDELVCTLETDKIAVEINAPSAGVIVELMAKKDDTVQVGQPLFKLQKGVSADVKKAPSAAAAPPTTLKPVNSAEASKAAPPSPLPTPPPEPKITPPSSPKSTPSATTSITDAAAGGAREHRVKMTPLRKRVAQRLKDSQNTYAMLTTFQECDMQAVTELRNLYKDAFEKKHGIKLGFMSAFLRASALALTEQPIVNAVIDKEEIVYRDYIDISVAVATPRGLMVPVVRGCDKKSMAQLEKDLAAIGAKAKNDQIAIEDMTGGTFTVSNGGVFGSMMGTPIINPPQSAILGMHNITKRAVVVNDQIVVRPMMYLALTYDHRLIDGREAVTFLKRVRELVEDPRRFLLDV